MELLYLLRYRWYMYIVLTTDTEIQAKFLCSKHASYPGWNPWSWRDQTNTFQKVFFLIIIQILWNSLKDCYGVSFNVWYTTLYQKKISLPKLLQPKYKNWPSKTKQHVQCLPRWFSGDKSVVKNCKDWTHAYYYRVHVNMTALNFHNTNA